MPNGRLRPPSAGFSLLPALISTSRSICAPLPKPDESKSRRKVGSRRSSVVKRRLPAEGQAVRGDVANAQVAVADDAAGEVAHEDLRVSAATRLGRRSRSRQVHLGAGVQVGQDLHQPVQCEVPEIDAADWGKVRRSESGETTLVQHRGDSRSDDSLCLLPLGPGIAAVSEDVPTFVDKLGVFLTQGQDPGGR